MAVDDVIGFDAAQAAPFLRFKNDSAEEMGCRWLSIQARFSFVPDIIPKRLPLIFFAPHVGSLIERHAILTAILKNLLNIVCF